MRGNFMTYQNNYNWVNFYKEFSEILLEYKNNRKH